ncbi:MAG TPA: thiamine diphosphokinase [Acidimicrobiia bacterium]|nr:thiamine diphosphokinase [Acidimicrobiia bacterium]
MTGHHMLVVTGGPPPTNPGPLPRHDLVIAADSGAEHAPALGLTVDVLVGDMDSVDPTLLADLETAGCRIERHPVDKDETDLELALGAAIRLGAASVTVITSAGGRPDHAMINALTASADRWADLLIDLRIDSSRAWVVHDRLDLDLPVGTTVSLLAVGGPASGITTTGLRWQLVDADLTPGVGLGMSNEVGGSQASIRVVSGTLLVIVP